MSQSMSRRPTTRALLGTMLLVLFLLVYVLLATVFAGQILPTAGGVAQFFYYAIAGLAWVPAAGLIIRWMYPR
ncbi:MAG: DUF2842 domain-containing protein [Hyphomicrobiaceae bacterium]